MHIQRFFSLAVTTTLIVAAILTARLAVSTPDVNSSERDLSDNALPYPSAVIPFAASDLDDYALRHRAEFNPVVQPDLSDYALRHPYWRMPVGPIPDLSDYALRHPELMHPAAPDLSDYYLRHRDAFNNK